MSDSNYVTCSCQHCNGHLKFDANQLKTGETRRVECPHCHLETVIFNKPPTANLQPSVKSEEKNTVEIKLKSSRIELFLFELTRFPTVAGSILLLMGLVATAYLVIQTRLPEKPTKPPCISYEMVAPAPATALNTLGNGGVFIPQGAKMAGKNSFPQPVVDFLLKHQGFTLKEWLDQLNSDERQVFLKNLAEVLEAADSKYLSADTMEQVVKDFSELWIQTLKDNKAAREAKLLEKQRQFTELTTVAFGMFISLMVLSLVLVMLAIERNTRLNLKQKDSK